MATRRQVFGDNRKALEATIKASTILNDQAHSAIIQLARTLADQVDAAGADVSTRLTAAYLSALKDIDRAIRGGHRPGTTPQQRRSRSSLGVVDGTEPTAGHGRSWRQDAS